MREKQIFNVLSSKGEISAELNLKAESFDTNFPNFIYSTYFILHWSSQNLFSLKDASFRLEFGKIKKWEKLFTFQLTCDGEDSGCRQMFLPSDVSEIQRPGLLNYNREKSKVSFDCDLTNFFS